MSRREAIMEKLEQNKLDRVPFVITYNPLLPNIPKLQQESQTILNASEKCSEVFKNTPLVSYRRGRNLNDMLCSKRIPKQKDTNQRNKHSRDIKQTNVLNVVFSSKMKRDSKYTAPQNTDDSKIIRPPLGSGLVNQTVDAILVEEDISALL